MTPCSALQLKEEAEELFQGTVKYWQKWLSACTYRGRWREQVQRSALALKLLTFEPTGAIVAAPTASLPEVFGGTRNWDYRYTWLRDAAFTIYGFLRIGFREEAAGFMNWIETYASRHIDPKLPLPPLFTIQGDSELPELTLDHWEGYRASGPVRIGNAAVSQLQLDLYGELMDSFYLYNKYVSPISYDMWVKLRSPPGVDLRELAKAGCGNLGDAQSRPALRLFQGHELGRAGPRYQAGGQARLSRRPRQVDLRT